MPYISQENRTIFDAPLKALEEHTLQNTDNDSRAGTCNYIITHLLTTLYPLGSRYKDYNEAIGVLECSKQELYRRVVAPYENDKIKAHGDVYYDVNV